MGSKEDYRDFAQRLKLLNSKHPNLITMTLSNIFTMRLIGNKTHGDLAEIAMAEFINQYMYDFRSVHVGKDLYRAKSHEEDIKVINEISKAEFPISLKAYGDGPLQLSTDKSCGMFKCLQLTEGDVCGNEEVQKVFNDQALACFDEINILPLIYNEKEKMCNIMVFDYHRARKNACRIVREESGRGRIHAVYKVLRRRRRIHMRGPVWRRGGKCPPKGPVDPHAQWLQVFRQPHWWMGQLFS